MLKIKQVLLVTAIFCLGSTSLTLPVAGAGELETLIADALAGNPALLAARDQQTSAGYQAEAAGTLADPVISFSFSNYPVDSFAADVTPMTGNELRLAQKLPFPGKLNAKKESAVQNEEWQKGLYEESRLELVKKIKTAYYRLYAIDRSLATVESNLGLLDNISRLAETRYQVGKGSQANVLTVHLERTRQRDRLIQLEQKRVTEQGRLNQMASRPLDAPITTPQKIEVKAVEVPLASLQAEAENNRPLFAAWAARIEQAKQQRELARLDYRPDMTLWAGYRFRDDNLPDQGTDFVSAGISFNLPINRSSRAATVSASESMLNQVYNQFADFRTRTAYQIDDSYQAAMRTFDLYQLYLTGIVPQARQVYAATMSSYQVGQSDFTDLLSSLITLDKYQTEQHRAVSSYLQAIARLEAASGTPISVVRNE